MKKIKILSLSGILLAVLFSVTSLTLPAGAKPQPKAKKMSYNINASLGDNLKSLIGKKVYVTLDSGKTFGGFVKEVGDHLVHLEKLEGKEYFDVLIRIENISAIDTRFRK